MNLERVQAEVAEKTRAAAEGRDPDLSDENLALYGWVDNTAAPLSEHVVDPYPVSDHEDAVEAEPAVEVAVVNELAATGDAAPSEPVVEPETVHESEFAPVEEVPTENG